MDLARTVYSRMISSARVVTSNLPISEKRQRLADLARLSNPLLGTKKAIRLAGYDVSFLGAEELRSLYREIFLARAYFFRSEASSPLIFDCGSNIGLSILFFKHLYPNCRIVSFEPDPMT